MKISWGGGIAIFYLSFMAIILGIVIYSSSFGLNLETEDYYAQELKYQEVIDKKINANSLETKPKVYLENGKITIEFANMTGIEGTLVMFRSSDGELDKSYEIKLNDSGYQFIEAGDLKRGLWKAKLDWTDGLKRYYSEEIINL